MIDPVVQKAFADLATRLGGLNPGFKDILDQAERGELTEPEAMAKMLHLVAANPELEAAIVQMSQSALAPIRQVDLASLGSDAFYSGVGLPKLNPLVEAALIERVQFDGDMPEIRTGPLPQGVQPAVPVASKARDPVALGHMLATAAQRIGQEVQEHESVRLEGIEASLEGITDATALALAQDQVLAKIAGSAETDYPMYRRGELPAAVAVSPPSGSALANLTPQERKEAAWKFLSTTQGRRTAVGIIREMVANNLRGMGLEVVERDFDPARAQADLLAYHEWSVGLSGPGGTQASFSLVDSAAKALYKGMARGLESRVIPTQPVFLEVVAINATDIRTVGWAARLAQE